MIHSPSLCPGPISKAIRFLSCIPYPSFPALLEQNLRKDLRCNLSCDWSGRILRSGNPALSSVGHTGSRFPFCNSFSQSCKLDRGVDFFCYKNHRFSFVVFVAHGLFINLFRGSILAFGTPEMTLIFQDNADVRSLIKHPIRFVLTFGPRIHCVWAPAFYPFTTNSQLQDPIRIPMEEL